MSDRDISERQMVDRFLNNREATMRTVKNNYGELLKDYLDETVGISEAMQIVVCRVGYSKNRGRALGLFLDHEDLIKNEPDGHTKWRYSTDEKRGSLIEAFLWAAEASKKSDWEHISRDAIVADIAKILESSELSDPGATSTEEYVMRKCREIAAGRDDLA